MAHKIFITRKISDQGVRELFEHGYDVVINEKDGALTKDELVKNLQQGGYHAVLTMPNDVIDADVCGAFGPQCKIIANYSATVDNIDLSAARTRNILVTNTPDIPAESAAEYVCALMLAISRRVLEGDRIVRKGAFIEWSPLALLGSGISKKIIGLAGLDAVAKNVAARVFQGFGMSIVYFDTVRDEAFEKEYKAVYCKSMSDVFVQADFVSVHLFKNKNHQPIITETHIGGMKKSAYFINISNRTVVEEAALVRALRGGLIQGAALDLSEKEQDIDTGFASLENVILTPGIASATVEAREKMSHIAASNIIEALSGRMPPNVVAIQ